MLQPASRSIYEQFSLVVSRHAQQPALLSKGKNGEYTALSYAEVDESVARVAASLAELGVQKGDTIGILSQNRPEWAVADLSVLRLGGIVVPIYPTLPSAYVKYIVDDSKMKMIFVEDARLFAVVDTIRRECPCLEKVILFDDSGISEERQYVTLGEMKETGRETMHDAEAVAGTDVATIVYTSGTTGEPKGVVLTHGNIVSNALSIIRRCRVTHQDRFLSFLPLSHMFERTCGYYAMLLAGASIAYAESISTVARDVKAVRPTILLAVPRVIEKAYDAAVKEIEKKSRFKRDLVSAALASLNTYVNLQHKGEKASLALRVKCIIFNRLVASTFRNIAGGRLRVIASGGAPLDFRMAKALHIVGLSIIEGYGLTETSPIVCCDTLDEVTLGTVGRPLDGIEVMIGHGDEVLVRGPNVMRGYLNKPEETARAIDSDGWFHTGDQGRFDGDGKLIITGRIKELIVTSYGKKVPTATIEAMLMKSRYIMQAMLHGNNRKYLVALIVPERESVEAYAARHHVPFGAYQELLSSSPIQDLIRDEVERTTENLASYEKVRGFVLIAEEFTVADGLLTPSLKLRKRKVEEKYQNEINALYERG